MQHNKGSSPTRHPSRADRELHIKLHKMAKPNKELACCHMCVCLIYLAYMYICFVRSIKCPLIEVQHSLYAVVTMPTCCPPPETSHRHISPVSSWNPSAPCADDIGNVALFCPLCRPMPSDNGAIEIKCTLPYLTGREVGLCWLGWHYNKSNMCKQNISETFF